MARILDIFLNRSTNKSCAQYPDAQRLVEGLRREEAAAINCLSSKISGSIYRIGKGYQLVDDDIEELHCDCIMLFIEKIRTGKYEYQGYEPATYVIEIAKNKVRNFQRHAGRNSSSDLSVVPDEADEPDYGSLQQVELLEQLLAQLNDNCRNLIRLKYLEEQKDKDVIDQNLTQYSTVDALKNKRGECMKKLTELAGRLR